ncbi:right-handed parallel beta-helix repeat-containing protein [Pedobacter gandavensis]|uniref:right-handed parallel beta-helix repeat-containing protein n=1 Tax=Pedobacter gandavensis TaxID=2679963 RepID=UPI0029309E21|nr:right-handed parallel beta-helix repeat-containing protein [Pedobacter gandavensis]
MKVGDALENVTWTSSVTIKNSRFEGTISRGTLITTRRKVLVENNVYYRTGIHAILIENDAEGWYESGPVTDVTIRNNQFIECGFNSAPNNYVISINPQNHKMVPNYWVHKNIKIEHNTFKVYDSPILSARSVVGLVFKNNRAELTDFLTAAKTKPAFDLTGCRDVKINDNWFDKALDAVIGIKSMTKADVKSDIPFQIKTK